MKAALTDLLNFLGPWALMTLWLGVGYLAGLAITSGGIWLAVGVILAVLFAIPIVLLVVALAKMRSM